MLTFKGFIEATEPYAVGMAKAMDDTGDKPPLKKSTINKAHKIAKAVDEDTELDEVLNMAQRRKRGMIMKRNKAKLKTGRRRQAHRIADPERLKARAKRHARTAITNKIAKGVAKADMSSARKSEIERRLARMSGRIARVSKKLLPSVRSAEMSRNRG